MNFLIINELFSFGGAEIYVQNLANILISNGHSVTRLFLRKKNGVSLPNNCYFIDCDSKLGKLFEKKRLTKIIRAFIKRNAPDIIVLNNIFSSPFSVYKACFGYTTIKIIHDYQFVCPKSTCITNDGNICSGFEKKKCEQSCLKAKNIKRDLLNLLRIKAFSKKKKYFSRYITSFISPSNKLAQLAKAQGFQNIAVINNPIFIKNPKDSDFVSFELTKNFIYVGLISEEKGIYQLIEAYKKSSPALNNSLLIFGRCATQDDNRKIVSLTQKSCKIKYMGQVDNIKVKKEIAKSLAIIVPSKWCENYPTTVLEGMAMKTLVIGTDRGGISEMLADGKGFIYDQTKLNDLQDLLRYVESIDKESYQAITNKAYRYTMSNNSFETYYDRFIFVCKKSLENPKNVIKVG